MQRRVGVPRAMGYYYIYPFLRTLVRELGGELVVSPPTTPALLERMEVCPTDEPCLPVKLMFSHTDALARREDIDLLLLPVVARVAGITCCPKFSGVPDMVRHGLRLPDARVAMPEIDVAADHRALATALTPFAIQLGVTDRTVLTRAISRAKTVQQAVQTACAQRGLTTLEAYRELDAGTIPSPHAADGPAMAVIGHPYLLHEIVSLGMLDRLRAWGPVITAEMVQPEAVRTALADIHESERIWPFEGLLLGAALHLLRTRTVARIILVQSFECGPASIIEPYIDAEAEKHGIPLMVLALDEHGGEAGLLTRLEAFMDTEPVSSTPVEPPAPHVASRAERLLGLPAMGHLDAAVTTALRRCGVKILPPPPITARTIELGREIAPEFVCFPFVATLGQMRELLDAGATELIMVGGKGYCRLGWYAQVQETLLRRLGYDATLHIVDSPFPLGEKGGNFYRTLRAITGGASWATVWDGLRTGFALLEALEEIDAEVRRLRAFERERGAVDKLANRIQRKLRQAERRSKIHSLREVFRTEAADLPVEETDPLRIRVTGEIWVVLEEAATHAVERWLGNRPHPRVWVDREYSALQWWQTHVVPERHAVRREHAVLTAARPWLGKPVGGHGQMTVGHVALAPREGMDGVLHVFPFTCMPEIIAQNIIVRVAEELDIPVLTYIVSEQTGEAGMETRLESFLDLLEERREAQRARQASFDRLLELTR